MTDLIPLERIPHALGKRQTMALVVALRIEDHEVHGLDQDQLGELIARKVQDFFIRDQLVRLQKKKRTVAETIFSEYAVKNTFGAQEVKDEHSSEPEVGAE